MPVIVISPTNAELDIVLALELGADDVISRPLRPRELTARIRAVLRRTPAPRPPRPRRRPRCCAAVTWWSTSNATR
ncbi:MAG: hypothetical protein R2755_22135 [Acidimicrobiales bacterium]